MRAFDKFFLLSVLNILQIPALFVHYNVGLPARGMTLGLVLSLMTLRLLMMSSARGSGLSLAFFSGRNALYFAYVLLLLIGAVRVLQHDAVQASDGLLTLAYLLCLLMVAFNYFGLRSQPLTWEERIRSFASGFVLYAVLNAALLVFDLLAGYDVASADGGQNLTLAMLGFDTVRAKFPMAYGINAYGNVVGVALIFSLYLCVSARGPLWRSIHLAGLLVCVTSLLLVESRGALGALFIASLWITFMAAKADRFAILAAPFSPLLLYGLVGLLGAIPFLGALVRGGDSSSFGSVVTDRDIIWLVAANDLLHFKWGDIFGSGLYGNVANGMFSQYEFLFSSRNTFHTLHNFGLQTVVDIGYIGFVISLVVAWRATGRTAMNRMRSSEGQLIRAVVVFLFITGGVEATPTPYYQESFLAYVFLITAAYAIQTWSGSSGANARRARRT